MIKKQKVLVVDDNALNIRLVANTLKELDVSIVFATNGLKAIDIVNQDDIDLILMDINMPELDGLETAKRLNTDIPIIFVTALSDKARIIQAFEAGGLDYITKPFNPQELLARVSTHLKLARLNKDLSAEVELKTQELKESMSIDHTTKAYNASKLQLDLDKSNINTAAMIRLKGIPNIQIAFGHEIAEKISLYFVEYLKSSDSFNGKVYSISTNDFICTFDTLDIHKIDNICHNLKNELESLDIEIIDGTVINMGLRITIAQSNPHELVQHLRVAQIEAENKNMDFYIFDKTSMEIIKEQEKNINQIIFLKNSFKNDTIVPFFQPIVESKTGKTLKYECLARIKDGDKIISPFFFIDAAKKLGAITKITKIMIEKSCKVFANSDMNFSINITKEDLIEGYLLEFLKDATRKDNISKHQITLEILEEVSVYGNDSVVKCLLELKNEGYKIALDDFGSENASFSRMLDLKIDILKIDAAFIKNIHTHKNSRLIVEGITHMAKLFDYEVVAEFVHNQEVLDVLNEIGIDCSQGYHFSEPVEVPKLF